MAKSPAPEQNVIVNFLRADEVYTDLLDALTNGRYPFDQPQVKPPQLPEFLPASLPLGGREHALFLFCCCYQMSGIESDTAFKLMRGVYEEHPEIFLPEHIVEANIDEETISDILAKNRLNYKATVNGRAWVENSKRLYKHWNSDPRNLFKGTTNYEELADRVRNKHSAKFADTPRSGMFGFQHKMVCMLAYFFTYAELATTPYLFPVPVDFHHLRVHLATGIVRVKGARKVRYTPKILKAIRDLTMWYCHYHRLTSTNPLADAIWLLSKYACSQYPGNGSSMPRDWKKGPKKGQRKRYMGRKRKVHAAKVTWNKNQVAAYNRSCGSCPIEKSCVLSIGAGNYYTQAVLLIRGERKKPPQGKLLPVHREVIRPGSKRPATEVSTAPKPEKQVRRRTFPLLHKRNQHPHPSDEA